LGLPCYRQSTQKELSLPRAVLDSSSNELAASILTPLTEPQRDRLVTAMADVERLILASQVRVEIIDPRDIDPDIAFGRTSRSLATGSIRVSILRRASPQAMRR